MSSPQQTTPVKRARKQNRAKEVIVAEKAAKKARKEARELKKKAAMKKKIEKFNKKFALQLLETQNMVIESRAIVQREQAMEKNLQIQAEAVAEAKTVRAARFVLIRTGSLVVATSKDLSIGNSRDCVAKALAIVDRRVQGEHKHIRESMTVVKFHCNGRLFVIPTKDLRKASAEEKKTVTHSFGDTTVNLALVHHVKRATPYNYFN